MCSAREVQDQRHRRAVRGMANAGRLRTHFCRETFTSQSEAQDSRRTYISGLTWATPLCTNCENPPRPTSRSKRRSFFGTVIAGGAGYGDAGHEA